MRWLLDRLSMRRRLRWQVAMSSDQVHERLLAAPTLGGETSVDAFHVRLVTWYVNAFRPQAVGRVSPMPHGSQIELLLRLAHPVALFLGLGLCFCGVGMLSQLIYGGGLTMAAVLLAFTAIWWSVPALFFAMELGPTIEVLQQALPPVEAPLPHGPYRESDRLGTD